MPRGCEAVVRPNMRFVPIKSVEQQAAMMLHRTPALLLHQRTQLINAVRGHLAELGLVAREALATSANLPIWSAIPDRTPYPIPPG